MPAWLNVANYQINSLMENVRDAVNAELEKGVKLVDLAQADVPINYHALLIQKLM